MKRDGVTSPAPHTRSDGAKALVIRPRDGWLGESTFGWYSTRRWLSTLNNRLEPSRIVHDGRETVGLGVARSCHHHPDQSQENPSHAALLRVAECLTGATLALLARARKRWRNSDKSLYGTGCYPFSFDDLIGTSKQR